MLSPTSKMFGPVVEKGAEAPLRSAAAVRGSGASRWNSKQRVGITDIDIDHWSEGMRAPRGTAVALGKEGTHVPDIRNGRHGGKDEQ